MRKYGILIGRKIQNPTFILAFVLLVFLIYTIIFHLGEIITSTFTNTKGENGYSIQGWKSVFASDISQALLYSPIVETFKIGILVSILSLGLGSLLAWIVIDRKSVV